MWGHNILDYYRSVENAPIIDVVSYDRKVKKRASGCFLQRVVDGVLDYINPIKTTIKELKKQEFDVIHLCTSASLGLFKDWVVVRFAKKYGVRSVVHFHFGRISELALKNNWEWKLLSHIARMASDVITMDIKSFTTLMDYGFNNIHYLPNPLSHSVVQLVKSFKNTVRREVNKVCFVGHIIPTKGVYDLVEACKTISGINLYLIGKGTPEIKRELKKIAGDFTSLYFLDEINHSEVIREMMTTGIFVLPSYTEGFPNVILESMACGCAIVTTPVGAIPEMLCINTREPCGLVSAPRNIEDLRNNILYFINNPIIAKEYGQRAAIRVKEMYAMPIIWKQLVGIWTNSN